MKKTIPILLLIIFLFNTVGHYIVFKLVQFEIKKEIKKEIKLNLQQNELTVIRFSNSEIKNIQWAEYNKEFIYSDQMYDIVRSTHESSSTTFYCINDKQEKKLFQTLEDQVLKHIQNNKDSNKKNIHLNKIDFFEDELSYLFKTKFQQNFFYHIRFFYSAQIRITTPPPRC